MENKKINREVKLNINYLRFIKELRDSKLEVREENKEKIVELYNKVVELRFNNIKRVDSRVKREELKEVLSKELKSLNISEKEFKEYSNKIKDLSKKRVNNYIVVKE